MKKLFATLIVLAMLCGTLTIGYDASSGVHITSSAYAGKGSSPMDDEVKNP